MMDFDTIKNLLKDDMQAVNQLIQQRLQSDVVLINSIGSHIVNSGGKRLRPMVALLAAHACDYDGPDHHGVAAIVEFIHTATLLHDDVVDASELRRGQETANAIWGNEASVLVGDFLYSRSFQMMVAIGNMKLMEIMADATNTIAEGEVLQLLNCHDPDTSEERYREVIRCKTAKLFEAAARLGAVLAGRSDGDETALAGYGLHLGNAFQLVDDILDYSGDSAETGKNIGDDLEEGKPTLPLIYALRHGSNEQQQLIRQAIEHGGAQDKIEPILKAIESTGAIDYTSRLAREEAARAEAALVEIKDSRYRDALIGLAQFCVSRTY